MCLAENEILETAYLRPFNFLCMPAIIHVSLMSWPYIGIRKGRIMQNTRYCNDTNLKRKNRRFLQYLSPYTYSVSVGGYWVWIRKISQAPRRTIQHRYYNKLKRYNFSEASRQRKITHTSVVSHSCKFTALTALHNWLYHSG